MSYIGDGSPDVVASAQGTRPGFQITTAAQILDRLMLGQLADDVGRLDENGAVRQVLLSH